MFHLIKSGVLFFKDASSFYFPSGKKKNIIIVKHYGVLIYPEFRDVTM